MTETEQVLNVIRDISTPTEIAALRHLFRDIPAERLRAILQTLADFNYVFFVEDYAWRSTGTREAIDIMNKIDSSWRDRHTADPKPFTVQFTVNAS